MIQNSAPSQQKTNEINLNNSQLYLRGSSLRNRLLYLILPTVLGTFTISGLLGYNFLVRKQAEAKIKQKLVNKVELAKETIELKIIEAKKNLELIAINSEIIDSTIQAQKIVQQENLTQLSIYQLEQKFATTKLLKPNQKLNNNLKQVANIFGLEEIFYTDRNGFNIAYSNPTSDFVQRDESWWQKGKSETQWFNNPEFDESANTIGFELVQAINEPTTGEFLGVVKALLPKTYFDIVADNLSYLDIEKSQTIQIVSPQQKIAIQTINSEGLSDNLEIIGNNNILEIATLIFNNKQDYQEVTQTLKDNYGLKDFEIEIYDASNKITVSSFTYKNKYYTLIPILNQDLLVIASIDKLELQTAGSELLPVILPLGLTLVISLAIIIIIVANRLSQPLVKLAAIAQRLAKSEIVQRLAKSEISEQAAIGNLDVVAQSKGTLEIKTLANSFNNLIYQLKKLINQQKQEAAQAEKIKDIVLRLNNLQDTQSIIDGVIKEVHSLLDVERVIYYQFDEQWQGKTIRESLAKNYSSTLEKNIYHPDYIKEYFEEYSQEPVQIIDDLKQANLNNQQLEKLEKFEVKASLIVPIFIQGKPTALLIAHQCSNTRSWQPREITFLEQIANQLSFALDRLEFLEQQEKAKIQAKQDQEKIQWRALELLQEVDPLSQGDLTIRARVTEDEIGTIADSYNATISSLHKLVNQVKIVAKEVETSADNSRNIVVKLAQESVKQAVSISETVNYIQEMDESIQTISQRASQAQEIVQQAAQTIDIGDDAMNQTVLKINSLQKTVSATEDKVKRLGESSQEISQVLKLISSFAAQTHLLALKASIEAARAGEKGKGFAVIADEVRSLANQSATATADIENFLVKMQLETTEVVEAMSSGSQQVAEGTELVKHTRQSLDSVNAASNEIRQLVTEIAKSALWQSKTSNLVSNNINNVALTAQENSQSANQVSEEITNLLKVAAKLQTEINQFKT